MQDIKDTIAKKIRALLDQRSLTQAELARKAGLSKQILSDIIAGGRPKSRPEFMTIYKLAQALDVTMTELVGLPPEQRELASKATRRIRDMSDPDIDDLISLLFHQRLRFGLEI